MPIKLSPLLHHDLLKRLWIIGYKLWNLGIRQISFLQTFFRRCLSLIIGRFVSKRQAESRRNYTSTQYDKADHQSFALFDNVDSFCKLPKSFFGRWQKSRSSLPLHHDEQYYHPDPQTTPTTSQPVVPYSTTGCGTSMAQDNTNKSTCNNSTYSRSTSRVEDDFNRDPPGLSNEISNIVGVATVEFLRYDRNFTTYVLTADYQLSKSPIRLTVRGLIFPISRSHRCFK